MSDILKLSNISKNFGENTQALKDVSLTVKKGEIHGIVGENGAGKSTLIKCISGVHEPTNGRMEFENINYKPKTPLQAQKKGISTMFQEVQSVSNLSIAENILLGQEPSNRGVIKWKELFNQAQSLLDRLSIDINSTKKMSTLSSSENKLIEMARLVFRKSKLIILDEPTANLNKEEIKIILNTIKRLNKEENLTIIYIAHNIQEVIDVSDRITVLKDGEYIDTFISEDINENYLVNKMIGRDLENYFPEFNHKVNKKNKLEFKNISTENLNDINLSIKEGQIYGIYGIANSGRKDLIKIIFGLQDDYKGKIKINDKEYLFKHPREAIENGIVLVPAERKTQGLMLNLNIIYNLSITNLKKYNDFGFVNNRKSKKESEKIINNLKIEPNNPYKTVGDLSGGNQQKVVVGKWLNRELEIIILHEPTRGIDVGAKIGVYNIIKKMVKSNVSVIVVSSEVMELIGVCDKIGVLKYGELVSEYNKKDFSEKDIVNSAITGGENYEKKYN
jgi:ABC-type sugar transport system ATPase subunit